jgi:asparagine synthase (glutamine-hydrolysing)
MCGITGFLHFDCASASVGPTQAVAAMTAALAHRGPDGDGVWSDAAAGIALGHRRLAIIDLSAAGHQPMSSADGRWVITYNGEIYNFSELRAELEAGGATFRGHSDTEVIVEAIARWGVRRTLERIDGMFAFAVWDARERTLTLARDRFGIKPLYWGRIADGWLLASELKAFRAHPGFSPRLEVDAFAGYLQFSYVPLPLSIYQGVWKLPPAHLLVLRPGRTTDPVPEPYWSLESVAAAGLAKPLELADDEAEATLDALLKDAVGRSMVSDVPLGAFLSGGIDSTSVVAQMQAQSNRPVQSFTIGFSEAAYDESPYARAVARHLGTEHTELVVDPKTAWEVIPRLADIYDEPFADSSQIPTYLVSRLARRTVTVVLSGDGGDELFAGYERHRWGLFLWRLLGPVPAPLRRAAACLLGLPGPRLWNGLAGLLPARVRPSNLADKVGKVSRALGLADADALYARMVSAGWATDRLTAGGRSPGLPAVDARLSGDSRGIVERMQCLDALTYLPEDILTKVDRASMAVSLESRVPFLDRRVAEFAFSLPRRQRLRHSQGKWVLRRVLARHLPPALTERPKMGFAIPVGDWIRGPLREWAEELLAPTRLEAAGVADPAQVRDAWDQHVQGRRLWTAPLWTILMYQAWHHRWMES